METLDIFILFTLCVGGFFGFMKGFVRSLFSWAAPIVGILVANQWAVALAAQFFPGVLQNRPLLLLFALGVFFAAVIAVGLIGALAKKLVDSVQLGFFDHLGGLFLGVLFSAIILGFIFAALIHFDILSRPSSTALYLSQNSLKTFFLIKSSLGYH